MNEPPTQRPASTSDASPIVEPANLGEATKVVTFQHLAEGAREVLIVYQDQTYRLRLTKNHKLILTK